MRIAFLHPDLGIGGAERLVVDAAVGLQDEQNEVTIYTSHCDKSHCFEEVKSGQLNVKVYGDFLPTHFAGRFKIVFATLRQLVLILTMIINGEIAQFDYFIVDQLSFCLPILHLFHEHRSRILFYCHFPDLKLAKHDGIVRSLYRLPFDIYEQFSMSTADSVVVNSTFTKTVYDDSFAFIKDTQVPGIIYPCVGMEKEEVSTQTKTMFDNLLQDDNFFLSINRFEMKKNIELAINAYAQFRRSSTSTATTTTKLVIIGGYDHNLDENKFYLQKLEQLTEKSDLKFLTLFQDSYDKYSSSSTTDVPEFDVLFLPSVPSAVKEHLLSTTSLLLYTPSFEHFGIVPLEAMKFGAPVLAVNNGGPVESIISLEEDKENGTGWLEPSDPDTWAIRLEESLKLDKKVMIKNGSKQVESKFTRKVMSQSFEKNMLVTLKKPYTKYSWERLLMLWRVPLYFILRSVIGMDSVFSWCFIGVSFLPPSVFQFIGFAIFVALYVAAPNVFKSFFENSPYVSKLD